MYMSFSISILFTREQYKDPNSYTEFEHTFHVARPASGGEASKLELGLNW